MTEKREGFDKLSQVGFWLAALFLALFAAPATAQNFPAFSGLVVDQANILSPQTEADLTAKLQALQRDTKRQVVVATIADLQGYDIADYGVKLGRAWGVGLKDVNNGAILIVAPNDRKVRIEVGYGLEPIITDAFSSVVISGTITPKFKAGDFDGGVTAGTDEIIAQLRASPEEAQARLDAAVREFDRTHQQSSSRGGGVPINFIFIVLVILFGFVFPLIGRVAGGRRYRGGGSALGGLGNVILWSAINGAMNSGRSSGSGGNFGGDGGGSDSGGGWGGGGFSGGGGGSFGGGGASGSW